MGKARALLMAVCVWAVGVSDAIGAASVLVKVADRNTAIPHAPGTFGAFSDYLAINGSTVVFGGRRGVYQFDDDGLSRIADTSMAVPNGQGNFVVFSSWEISGSHVTFRAGSFDNLSPGGIYLFNGANLRHVVDVRTPIPNGTGNFGDIGTWTMSGPRVAFCGGDYITCGPLGTQRGIYLFDGTGLSRVADTSTPVPDGPGNFSVFLGPETSGRNIAFLGFAETPLRRLPGIYLFDGSSLTRVVDTNTAIPNGLGTFTSLDHPRISEAHIAFLGEGDAAQRGLYLATGTTVTRIADMNTAIPNGTGNFTGFGEPRIIGGDPKISGGNVAFFGAGDLGQQGIYLYYGTVLTRIADTSTAIPAGTGNFTEFFSPAISGGNVVFFAKGNSGQIGLYLFDGLSLGRLADTMTAIPGGTGNFTGFSAIPGLMPNPVISGNNVAFYGTGNSAQEGIYLARLSPSPSAIPTLSEWGLVLMMMLFATGGLWAVRRRSQ